jgi:hypothetical protein
VSGAGLPLELPRGCKAGDGQQGERAMNDLIVGFICPFPFSMVSSEFAGRSSGGFSWIGKNLWSNVVPGENPCSQELPKRTSLLADFAHFGKTVQFLFGSMVMGCKLFLHLRHSSPKSGEVKFSTKFAEFATGAERAVNTIFQEN